MAGKKKALHVVALELEVALEFELEGKGRGREGKGRGGLVTGARESLVNGRGERVGLVWREVQRGNNVVIAVVHHQYLLYLRGNRLVQAARSRWGKERGGQVSGVRERK